jgi:hypothetical protein
MTTSGEFFQQSGSDTYGLTLRQSNSATAGWGFWADTSGNLKISRYATTYGTPALSIDLSGNSTYLATGLCTFGAATCVSNTEASTGGAGSLATAGGIYAAKSIVTGNPAGGTAATARHGIYHAGIIVATGYIEEDRNGVLYKVLVST